MNSFRDFIKGDLLGKLVSDTKEMRIFNEADLQVRAAYHLDKEYYPDLYLANQPAIPVGRARGKMAVKPDIVLYKDNGGPQAAIELKCFLKAKNPSIVGIAKSVWNDCVKLRKFRERYGESKNAFSIIFADLDRDNFESLSRAFSGTREEWMRHYHFIHLVSVFCDENGRKRPWYDEWESEMRAWKKYFSDDWGRNITIG